MTVNCLGLPGHGFCIGESVQRAVCSLVSCNAKPDQAFFFWTSVYHHVATDRASSA